MSEGDRTKTALFVVATPYPGAPTVTLFETTWTEHIVKRHVEMTGKMPDVQAVVKNVSTVSTGTSAPNYVVFTNKDIVSPSGTPLGVIVDTEQGEIVTAYYNRTLKVIQSDQVLWSQSDVE